MPAPSINGYKVSLTGTRAGGEEWSTGFWTVPVALVDDPTQAELNAYADALWALWSTAWTSLKPVASVNTKPTKLKVNFYPASSLVSTMTSESGSELGPGTSAAPHPYQCAVVCSLRTALSGRRGRGRMYLPCDGASMAIAGQYSSGVPPLVATAMQTFFDDVNLEEPSAATAAVLAVRSEADGAYHVVNRIIVDSIPDIQRRRVNQLAATTVAQEDLA